MSRIECSASEVLSQALEWLPKGAFLTVRHGNRINTMTIGWATGGIMWTRPVLMVAVRRSRHTYDLMERAPDFTVSVPTDDAMKEALAYCGTHSGRDVDKVAQAGLQLAEGSAVASPVIGLNGIHFECTTVHRESMSPERMAPALSGMYPRDDYHSFYFGEIAACYRTDQNG